MQAIIRRLTRKIAKLGDKAIYIGDDPFKDLVKKGLVSATKSGDIIACYITPEGKIECAIQSKSTKLWTFYQALQPIWFDATLVETKPIRFRGGKYDQVTKRVLHKVV